MNRRFMASISLGLIAGTCIQAQEQHSEIVTIPSGDRLLRWHGKTGRSYFLQSSDPNNPLQSWLWSPIIESGNDEDISYEIGSTAGHAFFRLHYTDIPLPPDMTLEEWDADTDGLSNREEIELNAHKTNPLRADTSGDGIPDGWANFFGLNPLDDNASTLFQGGPSTNLQAYKAGVQPIQGATIDDHDGDGIGNENDTEPDNPDEFRAVIRTDHLSVLREQETEERHTETTTSSYSLDRIYLRYPEHGIVAPTAYATHDPVSGVLEKATVHIEANEPRGYLRSIRILDVLDTDYPSQFSGNPALEQRSPHDFHIHPWSIQSGSVLITPGVDDLTQSTPVLNHGVFTPEVGLISDLNNDGKIDPEDNGIRVAALDPAASPDDIANGTEYLFVNDRISNGLQDVEDPKAQPGTTSDDDVQEIRLQLDTKFGTVRFDHPAIDKIDFYESKSCLNKVTFPLDLKTDTLPKRLFLRTNDEFDGEVPGDLVMKFKATENDAEIDAARLRLTIVHRVGDEKYFHAARDYMLELNYKLCIRHETLEWTASNGDPLSSRRKIVMMRHESTSMRTVETFHRNPKLKGIGAVASTYGTDDVIVNGNFCFKPGIRPMPNQMTSRCHGVLISQSAVHPATSTGGSSPLEGPNAEHIGYDSQNRIDIQTGIVPTNPISHEEAMGGLASDLDASLGNYPYGWHPWYGIGVAGQDKVFFVATPENITDQGGASVFKQKLKDSGVPTLPGGQSGEIQCIAGDGGTSLGLAHRLEGEALTVRLAGKKHQTTPLTGMLARGSYFINTYLAFKSENPR